MILEPNAMSAVAELKTNVVVVAGPGAGKTELLAQRADFLLTTGMCRYPQRILAISFKVDAARNIAERVRKRCGESLAVRFDSFTFHAFAKRIVDNYRASLTGNSTLDPDYTIHPTDRLPRRQVTFDDLVALAIEILQTNAYARNAVRQTYTHVFLDEFQDSTSSQYALVKEAFLESGAVVTAVGDTKQRIMSWAGALDGILQTFAADFTAQSLTLYQNYRSQPVLRRMQNRMVQVMEPSAAMPMVELAGIAGSVQVRPFSSSRDEADGIADQIEAWLDAGVPPSEIAILVRQQPHLVCGVLIDGLNARGIATRNEQVRQDLTAEPAAAVILNLIRVLADDRRARAYEQLMRVIVRSAPTEEMALRRARTTARFLSAKRELLRESAIAPAEPEVWEAIISEFLDLVTRPVLHMLAPGYQHGPRLDQVVEQTLSEFRAELERDGDPVASLKRLSEEDSVRILTIHKCKGLEFDKVVVLGVESQFFWGGTIERYRAEFFVAVSRARNELVLTWSEIRPRPVGVSPRWEERRHPMQEFLDYARE